MSFTSEMCLAMLSVICCVFRYCGDMFQFYVQVSVLWSHLYVFILEKSTQDIKCSICSIMLFLVLFLLSSGVFNRTDQIDCLLSFS